LVFGFWFLVFGFWFLVFVLLLGAMIKSGVCQEKEAM